MADYFTHLSFMLEKVAVGEQALADVEKALEACQAVAEEDGELYDSGFPADITVDLDFDAGFGLAWERQEGDLWIHDDDGSPNIELLAEVLHAVIKHHNVDELVGFCWGSTCSRPLTDAYGGGAVTITKDEVKYLYTESWLHEQEKFHKEAGPRGPEGEKVEG